MFGLGSHQRVDSWRVINVSCLQVLTAICIHLELSSQRVSDNTVGIFTISLFAWDLKNNYCINYQAESVRSVTIPCICPANCISMFVCFCSEQGTRTFMNRFCGSFLGYQHQNGWHQPQFLSAYTPRVPL